MTSGRYSKGLTILLIIAILGIIGVLIFIGVDVYNKFYLEKETSQGVSRFDEKIPDIVNNQITDDATTDNKTNEISNLIDPYANIQNTTTDTTTDNTDSNVVTYKGFIQEGTITIPSTGLASPVLERATKNALEVAIAIQTGPGLNQVGNTVLAGHNYRNGTLFSNNKEIGLGDKIYIKDTSGLTVTYSVYEKTEILPEDASYINRDTNGKREITLYTCNDDSSMRIIIKAVEQ